MLKSTYSMQFLVIISFEYYEIYAGESTVKRKRNYLQPKKYHTMQVGGNPKQDYVFDLKKKHLLVIDKIICVLGSLFW